MPLHNDGDYVAVKVKRDVRRPCALVAHDEGGISTAVDAREATEKDDKHLLVGWLHPKRGELTDGGMVLDDAQYTGTFVAPMVEPKGWQYGNAVYWRREGLNTERKGVFVGWLLECKFGYARVLIDANGPP